MYFYQTKKRNIPNEVALVRKEIHMDRKASLPPSAASQPLSFIHKPRAAALKRRIPESDAMVSLTSH